MTAQSLAGQIFVTGENGRDDRLVLGEGGQHAVAHTQLQAAVRGEAALQGERLFGDEAVLTCGVPTRRAARKPLCLLVFLNSH